LGVQTLRAADQDEITYAPVLVARRAPAPTRILSVYGCAAVIVFFTGLSSWLLIAAQAGPGDLGLVERLTSAVQASFPLVVALALRRAARATLASARPRAVRAGR
jgi:hypothetical protein